MPNPRKKQIPPPREVNWRGDFDAYAYPIRPRQKPLPAPLSGIFDPPFVCVKVNVEWLSHLLGMIDVLTEPDAWEGSDDGIYHAQNEIMKLIAVLRDGSGCVETEMLDFRLTDACVMQFSVDGGASWQDVSGWSANALGCFKGDTGETGDTGAQGPEGPAGEQGPPGENCTCEPTNQPPDPPASDDPQRNDKFCGMAVAIIDYMKSFSDDLVSQATIGTDIGAIVAAVIGATGVGDVIVDNVVTIVNDIFVLGIDLYNAAITTDVVEAMKCEMYCEIKLQNGWSSAVWEPWKARVRQNSVFTIFNSPFIELFMTINGAKTDNFWNARASIGNASPSTFCETCECDECSDPETVALTSDDHGNWQILSGVDTSSFPASHLHDLSPARTVTGHFTTRGAEVDDECVSGHAADCECVAVVRQFEDSINLCSLTVDWNIFLHATGTETQGNNSSTVLVYIQYDSDHGGGIEVLVNNVFPIGTSQPRVSMWSGDKSGVFQIVLAHFAGGSYGAITGVQIN